MRTPLTCLVIVLALLCVACGSSAKRLDTPAVLAALHEAGFAKLKVRSNRKAYEQLARKTHEPSRAAQAADIDAIMTRSAAANLLLSPLLAIRYRSQAYAEKAFKNNTTLFERSLTRQERALLPRGYRLSHVRLARACNVLLYSYNRAGSTSLSNRVERAATLLRKLCS
jgi:hypothetical protein